MFEGAITVANELTARISTLKNQRDTRKIGISALLAQRALRTASSVTSQFHFRHYSARPAIGLRYFGGLAIDLHNGDFGFGDWWSDG